MTAWLAIHPCRFMVIYDLKKLYKKTAQDNNLRCRKLNQVFLTNR